MEVGDEIRYLLLPNSMVKVSLKIVFYLYAGIGINIRNNYSVGQKLVVLTVWWSMVRI